MRTNGNLIKYLDELNGSVNDSMDNNEWSRRSILKTSGAAVGVALSGSLLSMSATATPSQEVGTWGTAMHKPSADIIVDDPIIDDELSVTGFENQTLRLITRTSMGGSGLRLRLTNAYGAEPVTFDHVTVGIREGEASIVPGTLHTVTFGGSESVTIPTGSRVSSDPVNLEIEPEQDLATSLYALQPTGPATYHRTTRVISYLGTGNQADTTNGAEFDKEHTSWFFLDGIDVLSADSNGGVVCLGDSITDGFNTLDGRDKTLGTNNTYPGFLVERINDSKKIDKSVMNTGISGNRVTRDQPTGSGFGESAQSRLDRDVLSRTNATDVIFLEGINDFGFVPSSTAEEVIQGYRNIIDRVHNAGLNILGATLTPFKGALGGTSEDLFAEYYGPTGYYTEEKERRRQRVNEFIRTTDKYDGVVDFDKALRDPSQPKRMLSKFDSGDHLHPNDAGYKKMAETIDLSLLDG